MKMMCILIVLLCCSFNAMAQTDSTFLTDDVEIQTTLKPNDIYSFSGMNSVTVTTDSLKISNTFENLQFSLNDLQKVRVQSGTLSKQGLIYIGSGGFLLGFVTGMISGSGDSKVGWGPGLLSGVIIGGVSAMVGSLIGASSPVFDDCSIGKVSKDSKKDMLIGFFMKHKIKQ
jgi:hypothetical protein